MQDEFAIAAGKDQVDARALEVAGKKQMGIRNDNSVGRHMRRNVVDLDVTKRVRSRVGSIAVRQQISEFTGQAQHGTAAAMVKSYTIFNV